MPVGYILVILAAFFWGGSGILAKRFFLSGIADPLIVSQSRVFVGWLCFLGYLLMTSRVMLKITLREFLELFLLGILGVAGANYGLYYAIHQMDAAVADVIQFTAPIMVALWMWMRGFESLDRRKVFALALSIAGVMLATGVLDLKPRVTFIGVLSSLGSAFAYAFLMIWGKHLSRRLAQATILHWAFLSAFVFWSVMNPPWKLLAQVGDWDGAWRLLAIGLTSVTLPYACFFAGLRTIPASTAGILSSFEPVFMAAFGWLFLGERLALFQMVGIASVLAAVALVERSDKLNRT